MERAQEIEKIELLLQQMINSGIQEEQLLSQLDLFDRGILYTQLVRPCTIGDGIIRIEESERSLLSDIFKKAKASGRIMKFVPASGAASRMFKDLYSYMNGCLNSKEPISTAVRDFGLQFIESLAKFPFFDELSDCLTKDGHNIDKLIKEKKHGEILQCLLTEKGLNYAQLPKGLIPFHRSEEGYRTPFIEHLVEAVHYARDDKDIVRLHFTVPYDYRELIEEHVKKGCDRFVEEGITFNITYSIQKPSSQTIAVDKKNMPVRSEDTFLVFRPAGHGALLENLNDLKEDIVFIKNIDNVVPDTIKDTTYKYNNILGGYLINLQNSIFNSLHLLEKQPIDGEAIITAEIVVQQQLGLPLPQSYENYSDQEKVDYLYSRLHRPLRICGMVKNQGEPGGGPFWIIDEKDCPLQIVESVQVDMDNHEQQSIFKNSSHFNPVDIVCGLRDHHDKSFDLLNYVNYGLGLITAKSKGGKEFKALELPGLWNGSMAYWNTIFVEVPLITFNPVKTINDLLRKEHQA